MAKGKVIEFTKERGFGKLELEDGSVVNFDASAVSRFDIEPGDIGEIEFREIRGRKIISKIEFEGGDEG